MNPVLAEILATRTVIRGDERIPLHSEMSEAEGELIRRVFAEVQPTTSIEIGLGFGVSALFACDALRANGKPCRHIILDPCQHGPDWHGVGLANLDRAGFADIVDFHEEGSEFGLPRLLAEGTRVQTAIIDGWHSFDHTMVDFFYVNRMLDVGGIIVLDDANWPAVSLVAEHILSYPAYEPYSFVRPRHGLAGRVRAALGHRLKSGVLRKSWDYPECIAVRKIADDARSFDWHVPF